MNIWWRNRAPQVVGIDFPLIGQMFTEISTISKSAYVNNSLKIFQK